MKEFLTQCIPLWVMLVVFVLGSFLRGFLGAAWGDFKRSRKR